MSVVGFDIGNHKCVVAVARRRGIDVLQNEVGNRATPSVVAFAGSQRLLGTEALAQMGSNAKNTINNIKRLIGRRLDDPTLKNESFNYSIRELSANTNSKNSQSSIEVEVEYDNNREAFSSEQIMASLFGKLKSIAELGLDNVKVTDCVVSCPPFWNDQQRRAMLDAANIAGLNVLRLMNETTAVGLNYGILRPLPKDKEVKVLFVDVGHSTTNASVISFTEGKLQVLGTASDPFLGGRDFDELLVNHFVQYIKEKYKMDVTREQKAMLKLRKECERVKLHLSANTKVQFNVEYIMDDRDVSGVIERTEFEALMNQSLLPRLNTLLGNLMQKTNVKKEEFASIEVVGGAVRVPAVQKALTDYFGRDLSKTCDGDESVARGCALMCAMISPTVRVKEFQVQDVSPYRIALEWGPVTPTNMVPEDSTPLFAVNNPIPSVKLISFNDRTEPFQLVARYMDVDQLPPGTNPIIGRFVISGMPATKDKKVPKIKVRVKLNLHGVLSIASAQLVEEIPPPAASPPPAAEDKDAPMPDAGAAAPTDGDKMETDAAGTEPSKEAAAAAAEKAKAKVKKEELKVESFTTGGIDTKTFDKYFEREAAMLAQDRAIFETNEARNSLESYVLEMQSKLGDELSQYASDADKEALQSQLMRTEEWLYDEGAEAQKSEYKKRLAELKTFGDPMVIRRYEHLHRPEAVQSLNELYAEYRKWVETTDEKYAHISADDRKKILDEIESIELWLQPNLKAADATPLTLNVPVTVAEILAKKDSLLKFATSIINKPKPAAPKVKVEEKKTEKPADPEAVPVEDQTTQPPPAENAAAGNMDTSS